MPTRVAEATWDAPEVRLPASRRLLLVLAHPVALVVVSVLAFALDPRLGAGVFVVGFVGWLLLPRLVLARLWSWGAAREPGPEDARLVNLARGLAQRAGIRTPVLRVLDDGEPNAFAWRGWWGRPAVAVSSSLGRTLARTELEAVVAHSLLRCASPKLYLAVLAVALGPLGRRPGPFVTPADDVHAMALTRYPPALVAALARAEGDPGVFAPLALAAPAATHVPTEDRVALLLDL